MILEYFGQLKSLFYWLTASWLVKPMPAVSKVLKHSLNAKCYLDSIGGTVVHGEPYKVWVQIMIDQRKHPNPWMIHASWCCY